MNVKIMAGDQSASNSNGTHWKQILQVSTRQSRLFKLSVTNITSTDYYVWFFNTAAVSATTSAAPIHVRTVPGGYADTWDFHGGGKLFRAGIGIVISTVLPATPASTPTGAGDDKLILDADYRVGSV